MKKFFVVFMLVCVQGMFGQEDGIKRSIQTFFDGLHARDTVVMQSVCYQNLILESITEHRGQGKLDFETADRYYKQVAGIPSDVKIEERLLSYKIQVDGTLAHVWTPYEFYANGKLSHSGVNSFVLFFDDGIWKIIYIIDTRRAGGK
ncbi:nuclear transport factor 2 family protein [Flavobacterium sp. Sd200]|uniref:nuclear transport factor 2 family protein n=1 Tax=Flavobacterium sp. Sd200 TaxID=2692211 RepID=UPI001926F034|nr:nuclear transport factor 2 family protein [Flavobacterium sp. Sd200]